MYKTISFSNTRCMKKLLLKEMLIGCIAGIISGLFASGGGMILVPAFIYLIKIKEVEARATSILCILPMVITSGIFYYGNRQLDWKTGFFCAVGGIAGGAVGARLLIKIPENYIRIIFILFLGYASFKMII